jgi:tRNA G18 (ribose-2'-O)-methylase SpoU
MTVVRISSVEDTRVADFIAVREAEWVKRRGIFIAEGTEVVRVMVEHGRFPPKSLLLSEKRVEGMQDVLQKLAPDIPVYVAPQEVMDGIAGFPIHRGCLAAGERREDTAEALLEGLPDARTIVVLEAIANHDNVGGIFRNALAFGADAVLLDPRAADPLYRKAIRVSMGATLRVPFARGEHLVALLRARGFTCCALTPNDATPIGEFAWPDRTAIFLGTEGEGLDARTLAACDQRLAIPMAPNVDSLNVATASGIALFLGAQRS